MIVDYFPAFFSNLSSYATIGLTGDASWEKTVAKLVKDITMYGHCFPTLLSSCEWLSVSYNVFFVSSIQGRIPLLCLPEPKKLEMFEKQLKFVKGIFLATR